MLKTKKERVKILLNPTASPIIKSIILSYLEDGANAIENRGNKTYLVHPTRGRLDVTGQVNVMT